MHGGKAPRKLVLGLKQVGSRGDAPHDRVTGAGFVAAHNGQYADALSKGVGVSLLVAETTGALAASLMTILRLLARQTRLPGATDNTRYGEGRASPRSFLTHHVANISTAIQAADARGRRPNHPQRRHTATARACSASHNMGSCKVCVF